jgi:cellobiose phosphorylase
LGIRPQYDSLLINPCVPSKWDGFKVERRWRGMNLEIEVKNPSHVCKGIEYIEVNGKRYDSATVPVADLKDGDKIVAVMGKDAKAFEWQRL